MAQLQNTDMLISTLLPGATYASGTFTIPWTALNSILANQITAADSSERLVFALLQAILTKQNAGTVSQPTLAMEVSNASLSLSSWEVTSNTFSDRLVSSFLISFDAGSSVAPLMIDGDTVSSV